MASFPLSLPKTVPYFIHCQFKAALKIKVTEILSLNMARGESPLNMATRMEKIFLTSTYKHKSSWRHSDIIQATIGFSGGQKSMEKPDMRKHKTNKSSIFHCILICSYFLTLTMGRKNILRTFNTLFSLCWRYQIAKNLTLTNKNFTIITDLKSALVFSPSFRSSSRSCFA